MLTEHFGMVFINRHYLLPATDIAITRENQYEPFIRRFKNNFLVDPKQAYLK